MDRRRHLILAAAITVLLPLATVQPTDPTDAAAMHDLSNSLSADSALGWSLSSDPCGSWRQVACAGGRVTRIQIGNQHLSGSLPPSLSNLTSLLIFEIMNNTISGPVPDLSPLSSLQRLLLNNNQLSSLPPTLFSGLTSLGTVSLDNNPFANWSLPDNLRSAASLVDFSANSANVVGEIPDFFGTAFPSLTKLALAFNMLDGFLPSTLSQSRIQTLWLNNQVQSGKGLSGPIDVIANMTSLTQLWLHSNLFTGPIPDLSALTSLTDLDLRDNQLTGPVPNSLTSLASLQHVVLTNNQLQGPVPQFGKNVKVEMDIGSESFCLEGPGDCDPRVNALLSVAAGFGYPLNFANNWKGNNPCSQEPWQGVGCDGEGGAILLINLQKMGLSGTISPDFSLLTSLQTILLSDNNLTGTIPSSLVNLKSLKKLDVSNNKLWGAIPSFGKNVVVITDGNPDIGKDGPPNSSPGSSGKGNGGKGNGGKENGGEENGGGRNSSGAWKVALGCIVAVVFVVLIVGLAFFCRRKRKQRYLDEHHSGSDLLIRSQQSGSNMEMVEIPREKGSKERRGLGNQDFLFTGSGPSTLHIESPNMVLPIQVLREATNNFSDANVLGRGGFATVYKGTYDDGTIVAVKRMESVATGTQGFEDFKSEIVALTKVRHRHLVSLLGYCLDENEKIIVFEYMSHGTLSDHLFNWNQAGLKALTWKSRLGIALDVGRGIEYLHRLANQSFIHRDLKPSNILLGEDMRAKVADFGLVRLAPDEKDRSIQTRVAGTFGYLAPEYAVTGRASTKIDVYSFGVILMELITGRKSLDEKLQEEKTHLVTWFRRILLNKDIFPEIIDSEIERDEETLKSIFTIAELAGHCTASEPLHRPDMGHTVNVLSSVAELWMPSNNMEDDVEMEMNPMRYLQTHGFLETCQSTTPFSLPSQDNTQGSIPTRPTGLRESFASADGR